MSVQLLATMRKGFARRFAHDRSVLNLDVLRDAAHSARIIGAPGFSMRFIVDEAEADQLRHALSQTFVVEPDYALDTFGAAATTGQLATATGRNRR